MSICDLRSAEATETGDAPTSASLTDTAHTACTGTQIAPDRSLGTTSTDHAADDDGHTATSSSVEPDPSELTAAAVMPARPGSIEADEKILYTAEGNRWHPPTEAFQNPQLSEYTRLTLSADGRYVYGHVADWRATHISYQGRKVRPPRSRTDYAWFHRHAIRTDDDQLVRVGHLTFGPGHAGPDGSLQAAVQHYDATCAQGALVHAGEDEHGIWVAGALLPTLSLPDRNAVAMADLSGDWRHDGTNLEMIAAHCVGVPGFLSSRDQAGRMQAMAADASPIDSETSADPVVLLDEAGTVVTLIASTRAVATPDTDTGGREISADGQDGDGAAADLEAEPPEDQDTDSQSSTAVPEGGSEPDDSTHHRALRARHRFAVMRHRARRASAHTDTEDACQQLTADIDAIVERIDPTGPDTLYARVLAAGIRRGGSGGDGGCLVAASSRSLNRSPRKNWVDRDSEGLPPLVRRVARHIERSGRPLSVAIPAAINWVKHVCSTGDVENFPGLQRVNPVSRAAACRAVAQWDALKARNRARSS